MNSKMRLSLVMLLTFVSTCGISQQLNTNYRTSIEETRALHYLIFIDKVNCKLIFPIGHSAAMFKQKRNFDLSYKRSGDTIVFLGTGPDTADSFIKQLLKSRFILKSDKTIYDLVSGYTYVDKKSIDDKHTIFAVDGEIFKQRTARKGNKMNGRLRRKVKQMDLNRCTVNIVKGKSAYDKYGLVGMNGVVEIEQKK